MNDNWEQELNKLYCDKCRADEEHPNEECEVEKLGGLHATKGFIRRLLSSQKATIREKVEKHEFKMDIKDYLPKVRAWQGGYDVPFDDGYAQAKEDILALPELQVEETQREQTSEYRCEDRRPKWVTYYQDNGEVVRQEEYTHQDGNFSNLCTFPYCRCRD